MHCRLQSIVMTLVNVSRSDESFLIMSTAMMRRLLVKWSSINSLWKIYKKKPLSSEIIVIEHYSVYWSWLMHDNLSKLHPHIQKRLLLRKFWWCSCFKPWSSRITYLYNFLKYLIGSALSLSLLLNRRQSLKICRLVVLISPYKQNCYGQVFVIYLLYRRY